MMNNEPSALLIGTLIVLQDTAASRSGAGLYIRAGIATLLILAFIYARQASK
jgi:hypothetical protein